MKSKKLRGGGILSTCPWSEKKGKDEGGGLFSSRIRSVPHVVPGEQYAQLPSLSAAAQPGFTTSHHGPIGSLSLIMPTSTLG